MSSQVKRKPRGPAKPRPELSLHELQAKLNLTLPEAQRLTGMGRKNILKLCDAGQWRYFWEGQRRHIITASIVEYQERRAAETPRYNHGQA